MSALALCAFALPNPPLAVVLGSGYLGCGVVAALVLLRSGESAASAFGAVIAWPLLLAGVEAPRQESRRGPLHDQIDQTFSALDEALSDAAARSWGLAVEVERLRVSLHRADERLILVDRLLASEEDSASAASVRPTDESSAARSVRASFASLRAARAHAVREIEAVLLAVVRLRVQVGLLSLSGGAGVEARDQLRELLARVTALEEVSRFGGPEVSSTVYANTSSETPMNGAVVDAVDSDRR